MRQPRRSRAQLRQLLLEAGRDLLLEEGLGTGAEHLTFKRVFERLAEESGVRVTNASVIGRIWEGLSDYQLDVLTFMASDDGGTELRPTLVALQPLVDSPDLSSLDARWWTVRELCRVGSQANLDALTASASWTVWIGVWALGVGKGAEGNWAQLDAALRAGYEADTGRYEGLYLGLAKLVGFRLRRELTVRQLTAAAAALAEGCALRDRVDSATTRGIMRHTGPNGTLQEWTLFGIGLEALFHQFLEPDPDWRPPVT